MAMQRPNYRRSVDSDGHHLGSSIRESEHVLELANYV